MYVNGRFISQNDYSISEIRFYSFSVSIAVRALCTYLLNIVELSMGRWRSGAVASDFGPSGPWFELCTFRCGLEQVTFTLLSTG